MRVVVKSGYGGTLPNTFKNIKKKYSVSKQYEINETFLSFPFRPNPIIRNISAVYKWITSYRKKNIYLACSHFINCIKLVV
jgi:hypothetical protein